MPLPLRGSSEMTPPSPRVALRFTRGSTPAPLRGWDGKLIERETGRRAAAIEDHECHITEAGFAFCGVCERHSA